MARVVAPEGRVLFSSLNLDGVSFDERPWRLAGGLRNPRMRYHLGFAARHPGSVVRSVQNYRRTRQEAEDGRGWGRRPLRAHEFRFVVHFATMEETVAEIRAAGLDVVAAYADDGTALDPAVGTHPGRLRALRLPPRLTQPPGKPFARGGRLLAWTSAPRP